jgi:integrase
LADLPAASVTRRDVASALRSLRDAGHNVIANRSATLAGVVLSWLARRGEIDAAPDLRGLATREAPRSRRLNADSRMAKPSELPLLIAATDRLAPVYKAFTWLSVLTGQRLREVSELRWKEIILDDGDMGPRIILPAERCKNGSAHVVPLGGFAQTLLRELPRVSEWTFTAARGGPLHSAAMPRRMLEQEIARLRAQFPERFGDQLTEPWTWHDLRRTAATGWRQLGASYELIDAMLNHRSGTAHAGTRAAYVHGDDWAERRALA